MKKRYLAAGLVLAALVLGGALIAESQKKDAAAPEYVLNYAENQPEDYPTTQGAYYFARLVQERTEGRIRILVQPNAALGTEKSVLAQMRFGGVDFARVSLSQLAEIVPEMNVLQLPYLYENSEHMWNVLDGEIGDRYLAYLEDSELELTGLSWYDAGVRNFYSAHTKICCLEDLQGMKIRVQESGMMADMVEALGAVSAQMAYSEVYSGLELGLVECAENNWPSYEAMQHYEVAPYYTEDAHARVPEMQLVSQHTWEKLTPQDQALIRGCARESALYERKLWAQREEDAKKAAVEGGAQVITLNEGEKERFREAVQEVYHKYCGDDLSVVEEIQRVAGAGTQTDGE